ncbi:MAG: type II secretion system protein GspE, partial [Zetaproteobacteria bacterium]
MKPTRLGEILLKHQKIERAKLEEAIREAKLQGLTLTQALVRIGAFAEEDLAKLIAELAKRPLVDLEKVKVDPKKLVDVPIELMRRNQILPLGRKGGTLICAVADPFDINAIDEFRFVAGAQVDVVVARESQLLSKLEELSGAEEQLEAVMGDLGAEEIEVVETEAVELDASQLARQTEEAPVVKLVNLLMLDAIKRGASDIHIEPYEKVLRVRYRIDGVLHEIMRPPLAMRDAIVSRIKILSKLDISERRLPQDGRIKLRLSKTKAVD